MDKKLNLKYLTDLVSERRTYINTIYNSMKKYSEYLLKIENMYELIKKRKEQNIN